VLQRVSMDFIIDLLKSRRKSFIMVMVNQMRKYAHFFSLSHPFKESNVTEEFMEIVQKILGIPKIIVSDRNQIFTRNFRIKSIYFLSTQLAH